MPDAHRIGPYSRPHRLAMLDGRTREARLLQETRDALIEHVGGSPSATQRALIERAAWLQLRVAQLDVRIAEGATFSDHDSRTYLAWSNSLGRTLAALGLKPAAPPVPRLADVLRRTAAA
ncbi:MAG TPA: hypothetical protein VND87_12125 [Stellaceae bacterium]|nr:hypothetical protein [Stellaceae bacterium]